MRASGAILSLLVAGCIALDIPRVQVAIRNTTDAPAVVQMVEFDYPAGTFGEPLGELITIPAGGSVRLKVPIPSVRNWALRINDIPGVTSLGLGEAERGVTGDGPLSFSITVDDGGLSTTVSRGSGGSGETSAPD